jgi:hypothetical protein
MDVREADDNHFLLRPEVTASIAWSLTRPAQNDGQLMMTGLKECRLNSASAVKTQLTCGRGIS